MITNINNKTKWNERAVQQLVRYEALFKLLDDIQSLEDIELIMQNVARQWKYFANVSCWRLSVPKLASCLIVDGMRGEAQVNEIPVPDQWDSHHLQRRIPQLYRMQEPIEGPQPPEHMTGQAICEIQVLPFVRSGTCVGVLSVAVRNEPFNDLDFKFLRIFGNHLIDCLSNILLRQLVMKGLEKRASHDALTGILNRGAIIKELDKRFTLSRKREKPLSIILADIDFFKKVNDTHGHLIGDEVLRQVSQRLRSNLLHKDSVGRYGGEEFLLVLYPCGQDEVRSVAERLRLAVADTPVLVLDNSQTEIQVTISIGAASIDSHQISGVEELFKRADDALYFAKDTGRNKVIVG